MTETAVAGKSCIVHREGSGQVFLRGLTNPVSYTHLTLPTSDLV